MMSGWISHARVQASLSSCTATTSNPFVPSVQRAGVFVARDERHGALGLPDSRATTIPAGPACGERNAVRQVSTDEDSKVLILMKV